MNEIRQNPLRSKFYHIIFEADTQAGRNFDIWLLILILMSTLVVMLDSVAIYRQQYPDILSLSEWIFTILFTIEYGVRIYSHPNRWKYISSFYGIVDIMSILPTYLSVFFTGTHYLVTIRALRLLRIFRILKMGKFLVESQVLITALKASRFKITVFLGTVVIVICIIGSAMYLIEGDKNSGFTNIPISMYWAVVTVTTVGYGDIAPVTSLGKFLSAILMILGYGILAVPTGIVSVELAQASRDQNLGIPRSCSRCKPEDHDKDAAYCKYCGVEFSANL